MLLNSQFWQSSKVKPTHKGLHHFLKTAQWYQCEWQYNTQPICSCVDDVCLGWEKFFRPTDVSQRTVWYMPLWALKWFFRWTTWKWNCWTKQYSHTTFFKSYSLFFFKILFNYLYTKGKGGREGEKHQCVVSFYAPPTGDLAYNPGMCPDWELNQQPFGLQARCSIHSATPARATMLFRMNEQIPCAPSDLGNDPLYFL